MGIKKLFAVVLTAGLCLVSAVTPAKATVTADGEPTAGWAKFGIADYLDGMDVADIKSFTLTIDSDVPVQDWFNGMLAIAGGPFVQKLFSGDINSVNWEGKPYDYEFVLVDDDTVQLTVPCDSEVIFGSADYEIWIGDWGDAYCWTLVDITFSDTVEEAPAPGVGGGAIMPVPTLPATGLVSSVVFFAAGAVLSAAGVVVVKGKKED